MSGAIEISNESQFEAAISENLSSLTVVHFWAQWAPQCVQMNDVMEELSRKHDNVQFMKIEAEEFEDLSEKYEISAVPTFIFIKNNKAIERLNGANAPALSTTVARLAEGTANKIFNASAKEDINVRLEKLINKASCVLFMKGSPDEPKCGFSKQIVAILREHNSDFDTFDILKDQEVRQGLKKFSDWPTYPQLYVKGELMGGLDIVKEMVANGEFDEMVPKKMSMDERLKMLINQAPCVLFMKGSPDEPKCGFSKQIVQILKSAGIKFSHFDILEDQDVRAALKKYSDWPTYPQLYMKGELMGGLDIVKEMQASGELVMPEEE
eukprot:Nk52_evm32s2657 gene=Nk52_evmTU32s2657